MPRISNDLRKTWQADIASYLTTLSIYSGTMPSSGDTLPTGTLLARWSGRLGWSNALVPGLAVPINTDNDSVAGTAGYAVLHELPFEAPYIGTPQYWMYLTIGTSNAEVILSSLSIQTGVIVTVGSGTFVVNG